MGYVRCLKHVLPIMQNQGCGRVVNLIGNDGVKPSYWEIAPGAANAAGQNLTLALAAQYGKDNITFVAVNPGPVRTERWAGLVDAMVRDMKITREEADTLAPRSIPLGRIAECEEVASLVPRFRFGAFRQRHHDRDRRRPAESADGPLPRSLVVNRLINGVETIFGIERNTPRQPPTK
jgi:NAD(P)-dependent dehydrogenase (short-subunit alcohol dehydrogenase family)